MRDFPQNSKFNNELNTYKETPNLNPDNLTSDSQKIVGDKKGATMTETLLNSSVRQKKRGIFPKAATNIMRAWLFQHLNVFLE